jgi:hypothetical protein
VRLPRHPHLRRPLPLLRALASSELSIASAATTWYLMPRRLGRGNPAPLRRNSFRACGVDTSFREGGSVDNRQFGEIGGVVVGYTQDQEGAVIGREDTGAAVVVGRAENEGRDGFRGLIG